MILAIVGDDDQYPDEFICEVLAGLPLGCPGVSIYSGSEFWTFVWRDRNRISRGVLFIDNEAARRGVIRGDEFTILVQPEWRRQGIATELFHAAGDHFSFELTRNPSYTQAGAMWASAMLRERDQKLVQ